MHPGAPEAESASLGTQQRKTLGVLSSLAKGQVGAQGDSQGRGAATMWDKYAIFRILLFQMSTLLTI